MGIEKAVERIKVFEERKIENVVHEARFHIEDEVGQVADDDPAVSAGGEDTTEEHLYIPEKFITRYKVTYTPTTTYDAQGKVVERHDKLSIDYDGPILFARSIFRPISLNGNRFVPAPTLKIEDGKIIEPHGRKSVHVGELDELVVEGLRQITSQDIQDALGSYIANYAQNGNG